MPAPALREGAPAPRLPPSTHRLVVWGCVGALALTVLAMVLLPLRDRAALNEARRVFLEQGERPPAPPARSGNTREIQENM